MLRADDINSTLANGANIINALTNVNEAHSADLARKKQAALDRLRFDTKIGDVERQRQMELLKKYDDDSIFGGIKELMGKYKTENPVVANAGGGYDFDRQVSALTGGSQDNSPDMLMSKLTGLGRGTSFDEQRTKQLSRDIRSGYIQPVEEERDLVADQKTIDKWGDRFGVDRKSSARKQLVKDVKAMVKRNVSENNALSEGMSNLNYKPEEKTTIEKPVGIIRGDVKSYIRKAYDNGTFVKEFKGSYSDMDSQNLNMYKPLVDEAVANGDWKAADMLNRQYMANKRSIDKSWGDEGGRGGVDSLFSGPPKDRKAKEEPKKKYTVVGTVPIKDANGNITGYDYGQPKEVLLTDWERRHPYDPKVQDVLEEQGVSRHYQSGDLSFNASESDEAVAGYHKSSAEKGLALRVVQDYENSAKNNYGVAIIRNSEGKPIKQITKKEYESAKASLLPAE